MERVLPSDVKPYAKSPVFTSETVPDNLTSDHSLKAGTWGLLTVEHGDVTFFTKGQDLPVARLGTGDTFVIHPQEIHFVSLTEGAVFFVEFHK